MLKLLLKMIAVRGLTQPGQDSSLHARTAEPRWNRGLSGREHHADGGNRGTCSDTG